jgi:hypothetical protein
MRRYDDPVEVRKGMVPASGGPMEAPEQFLWQGRLWRVRDVVAHWVETGAWWQTRTSDADLLAEREVWRVAAGRPGAPGPDGAASGVFDLAFDWVGGGWVLTRCLD